MQRFGVHLVPAEELVDEVEALAARVGGRAGVEAVLHDLDRSATVVDVPGRAVWGFTWNDQDNRTKRWWPQGITTSADQGDPEDIDGRSIIVTSAYSHEFEGLNKGSRLSFVDITDRSVVRYRHVLLVEAFFGDDGQVDVRPVKLHAGGIVWHGDYIHVAGTTRGIHSFRLEDVVRVKPSNERSRLGLLPDGTVDSFGYEFLLPVRFTYDAAAARGTAKMRYSFLSLDRTASPPRLVAGEYGRGDQTTRLAHYAIDPTTSLLSIDSTGIAQPLDLQQGGVPGMQGATVVGGTYYVTNSHGRLAHGSLWVGKPGRLREIPWALPPGPEDITYWPSRDELWSVTEHPERRYVFAMDRSSLRVTRRARAASAMSRGISRLALWIRGT